MEPRITETVLQRIRFGHTVTMPSKAIEGIVIGITVHKILDEELYRFEANIAGRHLKDIVYPSDWWQAFKERWFPKWLRKRFPVNYTEHKIHALYPDINLGDHTAIPFIEVKSLVENC